MKKWSTAAEVSAYLDVLYGAGQGSSIAERSKPTSGPAKVVHSVAAWRQPNSIGGKDDHGGQLRIIKIIPGVSPASSSDWFILNMARARSAALVVTGKILREEPCVRHDEWFSGPMLSGLLPWRVDHCGYTKNNTSCEGEEEAPAAAGVTVNVLCGDGRETQQQGESSSSREAVGVVVSCLEDDDDCGGLPASLQPASVVLSRNPSALVTHGLVAQGNGRKVVLCGGCGGKKSNTTATDGGVLNTIHGYGYADETTRGDVMTAARVTHIPHEVDGIRGIRDATRFAVSHFGHVLIEAGETAGELYDTPQEIAPLGDGVRKQNDQITFAAALRSGLVDELLLSVYEGPTLAADLLGAHCAFASVDECRSWFPNEACAAQPFEEESGQWRFYRFWR